MAPGREAGIGGDPELRQKVCPIWRFWQPPHPQVWVLTSSIKSTVKPLAAAMRAPNVPGQSSSSYYLR